MTIIIPESSRPRVQESLIIFVIQALFEKFYGRDESNLMDTIEILIAHRVFSTSLNFERKLERLDYLVTVLVTNGFDALELAELSSVKMALVDLHLNEEIGAVETVARLAGDLGIPSIFILTHRDLQIVSGEQLRDGVGYIVDEANDHEIRTAIEFGLSVHQKSQEISSTLEWHRLKADAILARLNALQAERRSTDEIAFSQALDVGSSVASSRRPGRGHAVER